MPLSNKLFKQEKVLNAWNRHWGSCYGRYGDLNYASCEGKMTFWSVTIYMYSDAVHLPDIHVTLSSVLDFTLSPNWTLLPTLRGIHKTFATDAACQGTLTPSDIWFRPTMELLNVLLLRSVLWVLSCFPWFEFRASLDTLNLLWIL